MYAHIEIYVVISLAAKEIYLHRIGTDLGRLLIVCAFGNHESKTEYVSREEEKKKKKNQLPNQARVKLYKIIETDHPSPAQKQAS